MDKNMKMLQMIVNTGYADEVLDEARKVGVKGATIFNTRGEGMRHESILGITIDTERDLILTIVDEATAEKAMANIKEKFGIKTSAHCICFTSSVDKIVGFNAEAPGA
jgi:nitrogen regulatory protein PII